MNRINRVATLLVLGVAVGAAASSANTIPCQESSNQAHLRITSSGAYVGSISGGLNGTLAITLIELQTEPVPTPTPPLPLYEVLFVANEIITDGRTPSSFRAIVELSDVLHDDKLRIDRTGNGAIMSGTGAYDGATGTVDLETLINIARGIQKGTVNSAICYAN